jgi:cellulose synthase/poly-beta-1,6-N-acetylglucosamine synthase-like glycosyltransferase
MVDLSFISIPVMIVVNTYTMMWGLLAIVYLTRKVNRTDSSSENHLVSIILPARNEERVIKSIIDDLKNQTYKNIEIIVIAHNCTDRTYGNALETQCPEIPIRVYELDTDEVGKGLGLQYALGLCKGDLIAYFDSDSRVPKTFVASMVEWIDRGYDGVQSKIIGRNPKRNFITFLQHIEFLIYPKIFCGGKLRLGFNSGIGGTGVIIRSSALNQIGGFRNVLIEDFDLLMRLSLNSFRIAYAEDAVVYDEKIPDIRGLLRQRSRWIAGHRELWRLYSFREKVNLLKSPIDFLYFFNPICVLALITYFALESAHFLFPHQVSYFATPWFFWIALTLIMNCLFSLVLHREKIGILSEILYPYVLFVFSLHWFVALVKSFFIRGWVDTKTDHFGG